MLLLRKIKLWSFNPALQISAARVAFVMKECVYLQSMILHLLVNIVPMIVNVLLIDVSIATAVKVTAYNHKVLILCTILSILEKIHSYMPMAFKDS